MKRPCAEEHAPYKKLNFRKPWSQKIHKKRLKYFGFAQIWAIDYKSLTWFKAILGGIPLLNYLFGWPRLRSQ